MNVSTIFKSYFIPKVNIKHERYIFNKIVQNEADKFHNFLTELLIKSKSCQLHFDAPLSFVIHMYKKKCIDLNLLLYLFSWILLHKNMYINLHEPEMKNLRKL